MFTKPALMLPAAPAYAVLPEGTYYSGAGMEPDVLVGRVRDLHQLRACLACRFYHIPAMQLRGRLLPVSHVALYLPAFSAGMRPGIAYLGRIMHVELIRRREIDVLPKASCEPYYRFSVDGWRATAPSSAYPRAVPYFYTSRFRLEHWACADALTHDEEGFLLFSQLQRLARYADMSTRRGFSCGRRMVICDGILFTVCEGPQVLGRFSVRAFSHAPYEIFARVRALLIQESGSCPL